MDDFLGSLGHLALGTRLKRTGTRLQAATQAWLKQVGCAVPASHMPLLAALHAAEPASLGRLVETLGIAQPGVTRMVQSLEAAGLVAATGEGDDRRVRMLALTDAGRALVEEARRSLWPVVESAVADLCADLAGPLTGQLSELEARIAAGDYERALAARLRAQDKADGQARRPRGGPGHDAA